MQLHGTQPVGHACIRIGDTEPSGSAYKMDKPVNLMTGGITH